MPVVSWLVLRGHCRACSATISARYPAVEALSALLWVLAGVSFGESWRTGFAIAFFYLLLILSFIDIDTMRLPNPLVALLAVAGLVGSVGSQLTGERVVPLLDLGGLMAQPLIASLTGAFLSGGIALAIAGAYASLRKSSGFGMGDVKLLGAIGIFLGPYGLMTLFLGSLIGSVVGVGSAMGKGRSLKARYPFGPFLALSAVIVALFGQPVWAWYLSLSGL